MHSALLHPRAINTFVSMSRVVFRVLVRRPVDGATLDARARGDGLRGCAPEGGSASSH